MVERNTRSRNVTNDTRLNLNVLGRVLDKVCMLKKEGAYRISPEAKSLGIAQELKPNIYTFHT